MLFWAAMFFMVLLMAAFFGFAGVVSATVGVIKILFVAFLVLGVFLFALGSRMQTG
jgi:uncharacterized membrane protein YtjA (UPF0391 family)